MKASGLYSIRAMMLMVIFSHITVTAAFYFLPSSISSSSSSSSLFIIERKRNILALPSLKSHDSSKMSKMVAFGGVRMKMNMGIWGTDIARGMGIVMGTIGITRMKMTTNNGMSDINDTDNSMIKISPSPSSSSCPIIKKRQQKEEQKVLLCPFEETIKQSTEEEKEKELEVVRIQKEENMDNNLIYKISAELSPPSLPNYNEFWISSNDDHSLKYSPPQLQSSLSTLSSILLNDTSHRINVPPLRILDIGANVVVLEQVEVMEINEKVEENEEISESSCSSSCNRSSSWSNSRKHNNRMVLVLRPTHIRLHSSFVQKYNNLIPNQSFSSKSKPPPLSSSLSSLTSSSTCKIIAQNNAYKRTLGWCKSFVLKLNLCPWAIRSLKNDGKAIKIWTITMPTITEGIDNGISSNDGEVGKGLEGRVGEGEGNSRMTVQ